MESRPVSQRQSSTGDGKQAELPRPAASHEPSSAAGAPKTASAAGKEELLPLAGVPWPRRILRPPLKRWKEIITHNLHLKLLSFALAVALWALVSEEQNIEQSAEVFLDLTLPPNLVLLNQPGPTISIQVYGPRSRLKSLYSARLELPVDLASAKAGEMIYNVTKQRIRNLPAGVQVVGYNPASLVLQFDERMVRRLPVHAKTADEPAPGYHVGRIEVDPASVTIEGPKSELNTMRDIVTAPIQLTDLKKTHEARYPLVLPSPHIRLKDAKEDVLVKIEIEPIIKERRFDGVEIKVPETIGNYLLQPDHAAVVLEGPEEVLEKVQASDVQILLKEGSIPLGELQDPHLLRYPPPEKSTGLPRLLVNWPHDDVLKVKRVSPSTFKFRLVKSVRKGATRAGERRGSKPHSTRKRR